MNRKPTSYVLAALGFLPVLDNPGRGDQAKGKPDIKTFAISLVSSVFVLAALALPQTSSAQVPLFQTTFASALCADWISNGLGGDPCQPADGIGEGGTWNTTNGNYDQILSSANNPNGGAGKGFRHYYGDLQNNNGGGIRITLPSPLTELWMRWYMRYATGAAWKNDTIGYTKEHYWDNSHVFGVQGSGDTWGIETQATGLYAGTASWQDTMGGLVGDGLWHCYEYHLKQNGANGTVEIWIDNVRYLNNTAANLGSTAYQGMLLGSNQNAPVGAGGTDYYRDFDDIAISGTGRVGCIGSVVLSAPKNLRVQ